MKNKNEIDESWPTFGTAKWQSHAGKVLDEKGGFKIIECTQCKFKHIIPIPTKDELEEIYKNEYYCDEKPLYLERHREDREWWNTTYDQRYSFFEQELSPDQRNILEIGSGPGFFLLRGKERGWNTTGIEPSKQAAEHSRSLGLDIHEVFLDRDTLKGWGGYDVVHMSEVLEHVQDPAELLKNIYQLLNPGGILCVSVPNEYSPFQYALRTQCDYEPWWVAPPHHINYFDFDSLSGVMERSGFSIVRKEGTFPMEMFLLMGENYIGDDALGRNCHGRRKKFDETLVNAGLGEFKAKLEMAFAQCAIGRTAVIYGKKEKNYECT